MDHRNHTALVTGANSGIGFEATAQLAEAGYERIIMACRNPIKAEEARSKLVARTGKDIFEILIVDVSSFESTLHAADILRKQPANIDLLILNAGAGAQTLRHTVDDIELIIGSTLFGHHILAMKLLEHEKLAPDARIIIAGSEAARGHAAMPGMSDMLYDYDAIQAKVGGELSDTMDAVARGEEPNFNFNNYYSNAKLWIVWWTATLARKLPDSMIVAAVSPGSAPGTNFGREMPLLARLLAIPFMRLIGPIFKIAGPVADGAKRYVDAHNFGRESNGKFYASPKDAMIGPMEIQTDAHFENPKMEEAVWDALVRLTGVDYING